MNVSDEKDLSPTLSPQERREWKFQKLGYIKYMIASYVYVFAAAKTVSFNVIFTISVY
jgi:hypothetical protein